MIDVRDRQSVEKTLTSFFVDILGNRLERYQWREIYMFFLLRLN